jgi:ferredoxin
MNTPHVLRIDRIACDGHGMCAELLPELIELDEWGYPVIPAPDVTRPLERHARRAVAACPVLALRLEPVAPPPRPASPTHTTERPNT